MVANQAIQVATQQINLSTASYSNSSNTTNITTSTGSNVSTTNTSLVLDFYLSANKTICVKVGDTLSLKFPSKDQGWSLSYATEILTPGGSNSDYWIFKVGGSGQTAVRAISHASVGEVPPIILGFTIDSSCVYIQDVSGTGSTGTMAK
ncbi:MAG TPA: hypothetical protein VJJ48_01360 [Candidatus Paceibacterota bacterium]